MSYVDNVITQLTFQILSWNTINNYECAFLCSINYIIHYYIAPFLIQHSLYQLHNFKEEKFHSNWVVHADLHEKLSQSCTYVAIFS